MSRINNSRAMSLLKCCDAELVQMFRRANAIRRVPIADLKFVCNELENVLVIGIIIAKQQPREVFGRNASAVWNFTIRDSPNDSINCSSWGQVNRVFEMAEKFNVGDVVEIKNPIVAGRHMSDYREKFCPIVSSKFALNLRDDCKVTLHLENVLMYNFLMQLPTKPLSEIVTIKKIYDGGVTMRNTLVDVLVAVKSVGDVKNVVRKGRSVPLREVYLFDETNASIKLKIWDKYNLAGAGNWKPRLILFITDVKVEWSNYEKTNSLSLSSRTVITEQPNHSTASPLVKYANEFPLWENTATDNN